MLAPSLPVTRPDTMSCASPRRCRPALVPSRARRALAPLLALALAAAVGCSAGAGSLELRPPDAPKLPLSPPTAQCISEKLVIKREGKFRNRWRATIAGSPAHVAPDILIIEGNEVRIQARFAYGPRHKDLEHETVETFIGLREGWVSLGEYETNGHGWISFLLPEEFAPLPSGIYPLFFRVLGDGTQTTATLRIYPKNTHLVVFDIDGTLTTHDRQFAWQFVWGRKHDQSSYDPEPYAGAAELTRVHRDRGAVLVYLTGRPFRATPWTARWLRNRRFARGNLKLTATLSEILPTEGNVGKYKRGYLEKLVEQGFLIDLAYGNSWTDVYAYLGAGVGKEQVYIIGKHTGALGTNKVTGNWKDEVKRVKGLRPIVQPWSRKPDSIRSCENECCEETP